jgi:hypothetical protein
MRTVEVVLREFGEALDLPTRRKLVLLREIRADFEGVVATLTARGCSAREARERALHLLAPTAGDARSLNDIHRTPYARLTNVLPTRPVRLMERGSVVCLAALGALSPMIALTRISDLPSGAALLFGCVSLSVLTNLAWHAFRLFIRQDLDAAALARAGMTQAGLIALALIAGLITVTLQAYVLLGGWAAGVAPDVAHVAQSVLVVAETAAVVLTITIVGFVGGMVLMQSFSLTRDAERELARLLSIPDSLEESDGR